LGSGANPTFAPSANKLLKENVLFEALDSACAHLERIEKIESAWIRSNIDLSSNKVYHFLCPKLQIFFSFASFCFAGITNYTILR